MRAIALLLLVLTGLAFRPALGQTNASDLEAVVVTDLGTFRFEFASDKAPKHVEHFMKLVKQGYYDGSAFFRVVANGLVQGGDPLLKNPKTPKALWGSGGLNLLAGEYSDVKHERGVVSTVRIPGKENSDGAQFFICVSPQTALDGKFSAFGRVTEGMEVVQAISVVKAGANQMAEVPVRIQKITLEKKKVEPFVGATPEQMRRTVTLKTSLGTVKLKMHPEWAPEHVRNFLKLTETGWFNGTGFHRVLKGFVAQGGMGDTRIVGGEKKGHPADRWVRTLKGEFRADLKHTRGMVSMARNDEPDSAATSFFLMLDAAPHLDGQYTIFAEVVAGMEVLEAFDKLEVKEEAPVVRVELVEAVLE